MIKVMHIAQAAGGVERYLYTLLKKLDTSKYENILVCSQDYNIEKFHTIVSKIICIEMQRNIHLVKECKTVFTLRRLIKQYKPDIVYMHSSKAGAIGRVANIGLHNVSIYNAHGWAFNMKCSWIKRQTYAMIERLLAPLCTKIIAISEFEKKSALEKKISREDKIQIIFNGIDFDEYDVKQIQSNKSLNDTIPKNVFIVGCVGRLTAQKAPDIFLRAARIIKDNIPNAYFIMVGDGDQRLKIELLIEELNLKDCVLITGWVDNPLDYIAKMNVATMLSRWEGFGLVLPEYMMLNKPIVATNVDAIPNVISNYRDGLLVDVDDYQAAANAVILIYKDVNLVSIFQENGRKKVIIQFNAERVVAEHEYLFNTLINRYCY